MNFFIYIDNRGSYKLGPKQCNESNHESKHYPVPVHVPTSDLSVIAVAIEKLRLIA